MPHSDDSLSALDEHVAPGLRLWMLIALVSGVLLVMVVLVCCFMRIRIPRTKRQIDLIAAKRKLRGNKRAAQKQSHEERSTAIVMNSMHKQSTGGHRQDNNNQSSSDRAALVHKKEKQHTAV